MEFSPVALTTLIAIADTGTFEAAAQALSITPSAVSQRVKALESALGQVIIQRGAPCRPTAAGEVLLRLARQSEHLFAQARQELDASSAPQRLPIAVNADSLATWFHDVLAEVATWEGVELRLQVDDQAFTADLMRRGEVLAAITSDPTPVQGCDLVPLGVMRYFAAASPAYAERWRKPGGRGYRWDDMPVVVFNDKDQLQHDWLAARGVQSPATVHRVPTSADFHQAVRLGLGWGAIPALQLNPDLADGRLVKLDRRAVGVPLWWLRWRLDSALLTKVSGAVQAAAHANL